MKINRDMLIYLSLGIISGAILDLFYHFKIENLFMYMLINLTFLLFGFSYNGKSTTRLIFTSFLVALFLSFSTIATLLHIKPVSLEHLILLFSAFPLFVYATHCFHYAYHHDNSYSFKYPTLYSAVWNTLPMLLISLLFLCLANGLIILFAFSFRTVGIEAVWDFYWNNIDYEIFSNTFLFFIGLYLVKQNITIVDNTRHILIGMLKFLFPFLMGISILFFALYLMHYLVQGQEYINYLYILIPLVSLGIIFFNAYYHEGKDYAHEKNFLLWMRRIYLPILFMLTLFMSYKISRDHLLDCNALVDIFTLILFTAFYALSVFSPVKDQNKWIEKGNIASALFFLIGIFLLNLPYTPLHFTW